jgi:monoterpene epsilon-lactone hydrolase
VSRYVPARFVTPGLGLFYRVVFHPSLSTTASRRILEAAAHTTKLPRDTTVIAETLGGRPALRVTVGASERPRVVLYLHGGGYTVGSPRTHLSVAAYLARETGAVVHSLDYRLAPEAPYPAAVDDAVAAFLVLARANDASRIAISGDSAGGGLAVATARRLIDSHGVHPAALALFSPWTDASDDSDEIPRDLVVNVKWGARNGALYAAGADPRDPGLSPMFASFDKMPPMWVQTGQKELLYKQILRFVDTARAGGADVTLREHPTLWHSGHTQAGVVREATEVIQEAGIFLRAHLDAPVLTTP